MFVEEKAKGEVKELDAASLLLLKVADLLEEKGWCQYAMEQDGKFCVMGAAHYVDGTLDLHGPAGSNDYFAARARMRNALGEDWVKWNNKEGRTAAEVIAKLRAVAFSH